MKTLTKIEADNQSFFLMTTAKEEEDESGISSLDVVLTDAINAWNGSISDKDLQNLSKKIGEDLNKYKEETRKALTGVDAGGQIFEYQVTSIKDGGRELAWKRVMSDDDIKFQLGSVRLVPDDDPSVHIKAILQHSLEEMAASQLKIQRLQREQERLSSEREQALKRLEKCVEMKEEQDRELYSKFCVILNSKKAKIRQLQQNGTTPAAVDDAPEVEAEDEPAPDRDMGDISTDEEQEVSRKHRQPKRNVPEEDDVNDSLILDDEKKASTSYGKRRKRKPEVKQPIVSNKPSIPRVPSTPKSSSGQSSSLTRSGRTPSLRSTPSSARRGQPMPELDASDLFEEM